jgi:histidinol-phosphate aminotransferase
MSIISRRPPNAPTGSFIAVNELASLADELKAVLLIDEAYVDFARENFMDLALKLDRVLVLRSLSKSYSLAGLRVGYAVGPQPLIDALFKIKDSYNLDGVSQALALAALSDTAGMRRNVRKVKATRERLGRALRAMSDS